MTERFVPGPAPLRSFLCAIVMGCAAWPAASQTPTPAFGDKPVRVIVPLGPGGVPDVLARTMGDVFMQRHAGMAWIVDNKPGANTRIGADACARAVPDGNTLCMLSGSTLSINPHLYDRLTYDAVKSFEPVIRVAVPDMLLAVSPTLPVNTVAELAAWSKQNPGKLNYGSFGIGSDTHLTIEWLKRHTGADITHVAYNGIGPLMQAYGAGDIQVLYLSVGNPGVVDQVKTGKLKGLAVHAARRSQSLPDVPTMKEAGLPPLAADVWFGLLAPAGTPKATLQSVSTEIRAILDTPAMKTRMESLSMVAPLEGPDQFTAFLVNDSKVWGELVKSTGAKLD